MKTVELIPGHIYRLCAGDFAEFSRVSMSGLAIFHSPGEPDMQSSFVIESFKVDRLATEEETRSCKKE